MWHTNSSNVWYFFCWCFSCAQLGEEAEQPSTLMQSTALCQLPGTPSAIFFFEKMILFAQSIEVFTSKTPNVSVTIRVVNRKSKVVFSRFFPTENRLFRVGFSVAQKKRNRKTDSFFFGRFFSRPLRQQRLHVCIEIPSCMDSPLAPADSSTQHSSTAPV